MTTDTRLIPLTQGKFAIVDAIDYDFLVQWKWHAHKNGKHCYALRYNRGGFPLSMHLAVAQRAGLPESPRYDHRDCNGLNNVRQNIRPATVSQNGANRGKSTGEFSSKYKGVYWCKQRQRWIARLMFNRKYIQLGRFISEDEARSAYAQAANVYFGEFARSDYTAPAGIGSGGIATGGNP